MSKPVKVKKIRARIGLLKMPDGDVRPLLESSLKGLSANVTLFPKPPIELATYDAGIRAFEAAIPAALDGSKTAVALKNKLKDAAINMYTELAHYVEAHCNNDMSTFLLSGFQPAATTKAQPGPLDKPTIDVVAGPLPGQIKGKIGTVKKALSYVVRHAPVPTGGGTPPSWTEKVITTAKPVIFSNLTPGTVYVFQVCALGRLGYTDWSDAVNRMCT